MIKSIVCSILMLNTLFSCNDILAFNSGSFMPDDLDLHLNRALVRARKAELKKQEEERKVQEQKLKSLVRFKKEKKRANSQLIRIYTHCQRQDDEVMMQKLTAWRERRRAFEDCCDKKPVLDCQRLLQKGTKKTGSSNWPEHVVVPTQSSQHISPKQAASPLNSRELKLIKRFKSEADTIIGQDDLTAEDCGRVFKKSYGYNGQTAPLSFFNRFGYSPYYGGALCSETERSDIVSACSMKLYLISTMKKSGDNRRELIETLETRPNRARFFIDMKEEAPKRFEQLKQEANLPVDPEQKEAYLAHVQSKVARELVAEHPYAKRCQEKCRGLINQQSGNKTPVCMQCGTITMMVGAMVKRYLKDITRQGIKENIQ
ncbi:MAG: hypothetical protein Q8Q25_03425 [bacterium]|nr:hypothetical protein [bacterium]